MLTLNEEKGGKTEGFFPLKFAWRPGLLFGPSWFMFAFEKVNWRIEVNSSEISFASFFCRQNYQDKLQHKLVRGAVFNKKTSCFLSFKVTKTFLFL